MIPGLSLSQEQLDALLERGIDLGVSFAVDLAGALLVFAAAWVAGRWARRAITLALHRAGLDSAMSVFIARLARWSVVLIGVFMCLGLFGVETTSFAAILGGAGLGVGLALKGELSNFSSGLLLLMVRPFREGDWVCVDGVEGRINTRHAMIYAIKEALDDAGISIPFPQVDVHLGGGSVEPEALRLIAGQTT